MQKTTTAIVAAASLAATVIAAPKPAEARCIGCWVGAGIADVGQELALEVLRHRAAEVQPDCPIGGDGFLVRQALDGRELALTPKAQREMPELFA